MRLKRLATTKSVVTTGESLSQVAAAAAGAASRQSKWQDSWARARLRLGRPRASIFFSRSCPSYSIPIPSLGPANLCRRLLTHLALDHRLVAAPSTWLPWLASNILSMAKEALEHDYSYVQEPEVSSGPDRGLPDKIATHISSV